MALEFQDSLGYASCFNSYFTNYSVVVKIQNNLPLSFFLFPLQHSEL